MERNLLPYQFALKMARKHGKMCFFDWMGNVSPSLFPGWNRIALPDGRVVDAVPLDVPLDETFTLLDAFA